MKLYKLFMRSYSTLLEKYSKFIHRIINICVVSITTTRKYSFSSVPIVLVGNKKDLHMERAISTDEGKQLADSWKCAFMEASAKQNEVFYLFLKLISIHSKFFSYVKFSGCIRNIPIVIGGNRKSQ